MGRHWGEVDGEDHPHKEITQAIIGEAIEIQKALGHGLLEDPYKVCLAHSLRLAGHKVKREVFLDIEWRGLVGLILSPRASARSSAPPRSNRMLRMRARVPSSGVARAASEAPPYPYDPISMKCCC
ncbi:GxxExxY protein [Mesoterricola sediminis]|uniref:Uncharacterized protein n=1 Tax=Mesoterricola sediminis TaxID=2927980 RepID=A0AA48GSV8_9BACT|nr:GxxExxY protein [Mesoterricola sediminis]BDU78656.1 hypothetical protein METESE_36140 [Mesoterricola sediminis]